MPARPRQSSKTNKETGKRDVIATSVAEEGREDRHEETQAEPVPEVRLLGSLHPVASREERIAIAAYWRAAKRQFASGRELDDWLEAEQEIDAEDRGGESRTK